MPPTVFGHRESWCLCGRGLSCFQHYKEDWNKAVRILLFTSFNECSSHLGPSVWLSACKGLAVENVHGITCSWGKHLPRIRSPPNCSQCKEHIYKCACIRQPIIHLQCSLAPTWKISSRDILPDTVCFCECLRWHCLPLGPLGLNVILSLKCFYEWSTVVLMPCILESC